jgi:hypothetical protein
MSQVELQGLSICVGMPVNRGIPARTVQSLVSTAYACAQSGIKFELIMPSCTVLQVGRDMVVDAFLKSSASRLFWVDSDMSWEPPDFFKMLALSTKVDVITAAYQTKTEGKPVFVVQTKDGQITRETPYGLARIDGVGLGFSLMTRDVVEAVVKTKPRLRESLGNTDIASVFRIDVVDGVMRTEDIAFFSDIRDQGFTVWLDPSIRLGHIGERVWQGSMTDVFVPRLTEAA